MSKIRINKQMIITVIIAVFASVLVVALVGNAAGLFAKDIKDIELRPLNENNVLSSVTYEEKTFNDGNGVKAVINENGSVKLSGKNNSSSEIKIEYAKVSLAAGEYTLWGAPNGANATYHLVAEVNGQSYISDFNNNKIVLDANSDVTIYIVVKPDASVNTTLLPVLCKGTENVGFYA